MSLEDVLEANKSFISKNVIPGFGYSNPTLVISDSHPGLTGLLEPLCDLQPGGAVMVRLPGAFGGFGGEELLRSVVTGISLYGCRQILVVGYDVPERFVPDYSMLKDLFERKGLDLKSSKAGEIFAVGQLELTRMQAVNMTVRWIKSLSFVDDHIEVLGAMVSAQTGELQLVDTDEPAEENNDSQDSVVEKKQTQARGDSDSFDSIVLPDLPEIDLPQIPELDLDSLLAQTESNAGEQTYTLDFISTDGSSAYGSGPVSIADMKKRVEKDDIPVPGAPPSSFSGQRSMDVPSITSPEFSFQMPGSVQTVDTVVPDANKGNTSRGKREKKRAKRSTKRRHSKKKSVPSSGKTEERFSSHVAQVPLNENVIDFGKASERAPTRKQQVVVDLRDGFIEKDGVHKPLDPSLKAVMLKIHDFFQKEFSAVDRAQIFGRIRKAYHKGQDAKSMLKLLVNPILRLGKKRYAIINDLLKLKDDMPNYSREVFIEFMDGILGD